MKIPATSVAALLGFAVANSHGTVSFSNEGTSSGWSGQNLNPNCSITEQAGYYWGSPPALRMSCTHNQAYTDSGGRYHAMKSQSNMGKRGWTRYYGFAVRLDANWEFANNGAGLMQLICPFPCQNNQSIPVVMLSEENNSWRFWYQTGECGSITRSTTYNLGTSTRGVWNRFVVRNTFRSDNTGVIEVWLNGSRVLNLTGRPTVPAVDYTYHWQPGLYLGTWSRDSRGFQGTQTTKTIFMDRFRVASSYAEAAP